MGDQKLSLALPPQHRAACRCTELHGASHPAGDPGPKSPAAIPCLFQLLTLGRVYNFSFTPALISWGRAAHPGPASSPAELLVLGSSCAYPRAVFWRRSWGPRDRLGSKGHAGAPQLTGKPGREIASCSQQP